MAYVEKKSLQYMYIITRIESGGDINYQENYTKWSYLMLAARENNIELIHYLLDKKIDVNLIDYEEKSALSHAYGDKNIIKLLLNNGVKPTSSDMNSAIGSNYVEVVNEYLKNGFDINSFLNWKQETPLIRATSSGHIEVVKFLLEKGARIHRESIEGTNALMMSCLRGIDTVKILLQYGSDMNSQDMLGRTPLFYAMSNNKINVVKYLLELGADETITDENINTFLSDGSLESQIEIKEYMSTLNCSVKPAKTK